MCTPKTSPCPITGVSFDAAGKMTTSDHPSKGLPLINLKLSQGGNPCINSNTDYNSLKPKQDFGLFPKAYYAKCPAKFINGEKRGYEDDSDEDPEAMYFEMAYSFKGVSEL